ncbi:DUF3139 domain-containing protein [Rossellomorea sp. KS-H15a]|uniref:DUF3139 domain-containing protein n=1 Tax=Rossellomorea sp. KS-H15a TaxID=2963940 RepID=UPI0020C6EC51|nr:DUF3139 domain-containing protein [Rossellomorea sp. KS-H15a]UTE76648.1 DUF3139 domain-containing protein [Rossellomorea sp. KS-H15a]
MSTIIKNKKVILAIPLAIILLAYMSYLIYADAGEKKRKDEIFRYLTEDKGYKESEITKIEIEHSVQAFLLSYEPWSISVVFNDEPNAIYYYQYDNEIISQGGISGYTKNEIYKHFEGVNGPLDKSK